MGTAPKVTLARQASPAGNPHHHPRQLGQPGGEGATVLLNRATAELLGDGRPGRSPHPPRPDAAEGRGQENNEGSGAAREERPPPPLTSRAQVSPGPPRPRPGAAALAGRPTPPEEAPRGAGDPAPPPPRTHRPLKPSSFRFSRRRAPGARPGSPLPRRRSSHSSRRTSRAALGPRSTRTATVLGGGGLPHAPTAAGSGAHDGPPAHCARVPAPPQPPRRRPRFRSGHSQPARGRLQVPAGTARTPGGVAGRALGVSWVPRGGARAELWALALRCILGSVVLAERGAWLASGAQGCLVSPPRNSRHRDL